MIRLRPGGFWWLLSQEVRLSFRAAGGKRGLAGKIILLVVALALPIGVGLVGALALQHLDDGATGPEGLLILSLVVLGVFLAMMPAASVNVLRIFYERGDLDLLLSAPLPPERVLASKSAGAVLSVAIPYLWLAGPFFVLAAVLARPGLIAGLIVVLLLAVLTTAISFVVTRALRRALGPRRARILVQVAGGLVGASVFLVFQLRNFAPETAERLADWLSEQTVPAPLDWPARALLGEPLPLLALTALAALAGWAALRLVSALLFESTVEESGGSAAVAMPGFARGLLASIVTKELRLIARDPELLAQVVLRLVFLIPALALLLRGGGEAAAGGRIAGAITALAGFLASSLGWLTVAAEDARDLLGTAPVRAATMLRAKLIAACAPPFLFSCVAAAGAASVSVGAGIAAVVFAGLASLSAACLQAWFSKPAPRSAFRRRQRGGLLIGLVEIAMVAGWAAAAAMLGRGLAIGLLPALFAAALFYGAIHAEREKRGAQPAAA